MVLSSVHLRLAGSLPDLLGLAARCVPLILLGFSAAMLLGALGFQYIGGLLPCPLCMQQRYAHLLAFGLALLAWLARGPASRLLTLGSCLALTAGAAIGAFQVGVEHHWWSATCIANVLRGATAEAMLASLPAVPQVRCDVVQWSLFGVSMAGWNALTSLATAGACATLTWRGRQAAAKPSV